MLLAQSFMAGPQAAMIAELFPSTVRYSGASIAYQIGSIIGGGFAPLIATSLYATYNSSNPIALYMMILGALSLGSILLLKVGRYNASYEALEQPDGIVATEKTRNKAKEEVGTS
jgi:MFS family permease